MSVALTRVSRGFGVELPPQASVLIHAVDKIPETRGMGIVLIAN